MRLIIGLLVAVLIGALPAAVAAGPGPADGPNAPLERLAWFSASGPSEMTGDFVAAEGFGWLGDPGSYCLGDDHWMDAGDGVATDLLMLTSIGACDDEPGMVVLGSYAHQVDRQVDFFEIGVDLDLDETTGCEGWDGFVLGAPGQASFWITAPGCDSETSRRRRGGSRSRTRRCRRRGGP